MNGELLRVLVASGIELVGPLALPPPARSRWRAWMAYSKGCYVCCWRAAAAKPGPPPAARLVDGMERMMQDHSDRRFDWVAALAFGSGVLVMIASTIAMIVALVAIVPTIG